MTKPQFAKYLLTDRIKRLIAELKDVAINSSHVVEDHVKADKLLLEYINEPEVSYWFDEIDKWYE